MPANLYIPAQIKEKQSLFKYYFHTVENFTEYIVNEILYRMKMNMHLQRK